MNEILISFIVPVYNVQEYLETCAHSILGQSFRNIELILVDDGSTDGSGTLCDSIAMSDPRVRVIHQKNGGVHTARNRGIQEAGGQYVLFVDADDWLDPDMVESTAEILIREDLDILRFNYVREYDGKSSPKINTFVKEGLSVGEDCQTIYRQMMGLIQEELKHPENFNFLSAVWTSIIRKDLITGNQLEFVPREPIGSFEDGLFNISVMKYVKRFYYLDKCFYHYRKTNAGACTANYRPNYLEKQTLLFERLKKIADEINDSRFLEAFYNRVSFSAMEMCLNIIKSTKSGTEKRREIAKVCNSPIHREAFGCLQLRYFTMKWRVYFWFIKHRMIWPAYWMTKAIRFIQKRG